MTNLKKLVKGQHNIVAKGDVFQVRDGKCVVLRYENANSVKVKFTETGFVTYCVVSALRKGNVKDKLKPVYLGVGILGDGPYQCSYNKVRTKHYSLWQAMLNRCYSNQPKFVSSYAGCTVSTRWLNFQNFAYDIEQMSDWDTPNYELDKDVINPGNKIYSRKYCCFVPREINGALVNSSKGGGTTILPSGKWRARLSKGYGKSMLHLGCFESRDDAYAVYSIAKRKHVRALANKYKDQLDPRAYKALRNYQVSERAA